MAPAEPHSEESMALERALVALSALLPEVADVSTPLSKDIAGSLDPHEVAAIDKFILAGQRCLASLVGETLTGIGKMTAGMRAVGRSARLSMDPHGDPGDVDEGISVYELFEQFDTDNDGMLSLDEFQTAFKEFSNGNFSDEELRELVLAADANEDGRIDIHEFTVWLYRKPDEAGAVKEHSDVKALREQLKSALDQLKIKTRALEQLEDKHEEEMAATHDFWRSVAKHAVLTIDQKVDLETAEWLGNGNYGFVLKATRRRDGRDVVVKMMGIRWAHIAVKEWQTGALIGKHDSIVEYEEVMLHADDDSQIMSLLKAGYDQGKLKAKRKRTQFPDRYICLTQELMNRGTVQDWLDSNLLLPGGMFVVMQKVARALAYLHSKDITHNDIKPENVMLHEEEGANSESRRVQVKLGDLGLATKSTDRSADFWQYGMTVFCMLTGERFGTRKFRPEIAGQFVDESKEVCNVSGTDEMSRTLNELPGIIHSIFQDETDMQAVSQLPCLQGWHFFDGNDAEESELASTLNSSGKGKGAHVHKIEAEKVSSMQHASRRRSCFVVGE